MDDTEGKGSEDEEVVEESGVLPIGKQSRLKSLNPPKQETSGSEFLSPWLPSDRRAVTYMLHPGVEECRLLGMLDRRKATNDTMAKAVSDLRMANGYDHYGVIEENDSRQTSENSAHKENPLFQKEQNISGEHCNKHHSSTDRLFSQRSQERSRSCERVVSDDHLFMFHPLHRCEAKTSLDRGATGDWHERTRRRLTFQQRSSHRHDQLSEETSPPRHNSRSHSEN